MKTLEESNIIYLRGNNESRNFDISEKCHKYKVLNLMNAFDVDYKLNEVNDLSRAKCLFSDAEFARNAEYELETV